MTPRPTVNDFISLFCSGRKDAHGLQVGDRGVCVRSPITPLLIGEHLKGTTRVGAYVLSPTGQVKELIVDIDVKPPDEVLSRGRAQAVHKCFEDIGLTSYIERSKSKGYHVRVFFLFPEDAKKARNIGRYIARAAGIPKAEVFPKQDAADDLGNYLYLPLHGESVKEGRTVFVDHKNGMEPFPDQWAFLNTIRKHRREDFTDAYREVSARSQGIAAESATINPVSTKIDLKHIDIGISNCQALGKIIYKTQNERHLAHPERIAIANYASVFEGGDIWVINNVLSILADYDEAYTKEQFASLVHKPPLCTNEGLCGDDPKCQRVQAIMGLTPVAFVRAKIKGDVDFDITIEDRKAKVVPFDSVTSDKIIPPTGFLREYIDCFSAQTDAPKIYHLMMAYFSLAVALGSRVYFHLAGDKLYPNMWMVLIGGSSLFRKTTALNKSRAIINGLDPKLILPSDFTVEALLEYLSNAPQGAFYHPEFRTMYGMLSKDYMSGAKALLTELYDSPDEYRRETRSKTAIIKQPIINMASATTTEWLTSKGSEEDFGSGFLARYLFIPAFTREGSMPIPPPPDKVRFRRLVYALTEARDSFQEQRAAEYTPEAETMYREWYINYDKLDPFGGTPLAPFHARYQTYVHKLAILYTVSKSGNVGAMNMEAVIYATATIEWVTKSLAYLYDKHLTFGKDDDRMKKILGKVPGPGKAITRSELLKSSRLNVRDFDILIQTLKAAGEVRETNAINKGHKVIVYCKGPGI
jgi:hypothetical protein